MNCPKCLSSNLKNLKHKNICVECNFEFMKQNNEKKCKYCGCSVLLKLKDYYKSSADNEEICPVCGKEQFIYKDKR